MARTYRRNRDQYGGNGQGRRGDNHRKMIWAVVLAGLAVSAALLWNHKKDVGAEKAQAGTEGCTLDDAKGLLEKLTGDPTKCLQDLVAAKGDNGGKRAFIAFDGSKYQQLATAIPDPQGEQDVKVVSHGTVSLVVELLNDAGKVVGTFDATRGEAAVTIITFDSSKVSAVRFDDSGVGPQTVNLA